MDKINTKRFINVRKDLNLSQIDLCKGICTQGALQA